jgi:mannonate dehydratase
MAPTDPVRSTAPDFQALPMRAGLGTFMDPHPDRLAFVKQLGVDDVLLNLWGAPEAGYPNLPLTGRTEWSFQNLVQLRNRIGDAGLRLNAIENVPYSFYDDVMLGGPRQEEQLEHLQNTVRNVGRAGIPYLGYNWMPSGVWRSSTTHRLRGGAETSAVDVRQLGNAPPTHDVTLTEAELWANYERFLEAVLPVAEEAGVTLCLHPDDPPVESIGGLPRLFRSPESFERAMDLVPSDSHALQFCLGNFSAMGADLPAVIDYFGGRDEIAYVHFQTISGPLPAFNEVFIDQDGYYEPHEIVAKLDAVGFSGLIIPGHVPKLRGDGQHLDHDDRSDLDVAGHGGWKERGRAFTTGYLRCLVDAQLRRSERAGGE